MPKSDERPKHGWTEKFLLQLPKHLLQQLQHPSLAQAPAIGMQVIFIRKRTIPGASKCADHTVAGFAVAHFHQFCTALLAGQCRCKSPATAAKLTAAGTIISSGCQRTATVKPGCNSVAATTCRYAMTTYSKSNHWPVWVHAERGGQMSQNRSCQRL